MERKKLIVVGNSIALVIDKSLRGITGIGPNTLVRVSTDGKRILVEPDGSREDAADVYLDRPRVSGATLQQRAEDVLERLVQTFGMTQEHFDRMNASRKADWRLYRDFVRSPMPLGPMFELTMRRLEICLQSRESGCTWDVAIQTALDTAGDWKRGVA